jgi:hypothetical protein
LKDAYRFFFGDSTTRLGHEMPLCLGRRRIVTLSAVAAEGASADGSERSLYVLQGGGNSGSGSSGGGSGDGSSDAMTRLRDIRRLFLGNEYSGSSTGGAQGSGGGFTGGARRIIGLAEAKALQLDRALRSAGSVAAAADALAQVPIFISADKTKAQEQLPAEARETIQVPLAKRRLREGLLAQLVPVNVWHLREELLLARLARDAHTMVDPARVGLLRVTHHTLANQLRTATPAPQQVASAHWLAGLATMTAQEASEAGIQGLRSWRQHFSLPGAGAAPKLRVGWQRLPPIQRGVRCLPVAAPGTARCPLLVYASSREGAAGFRLDSCQAPEKLSQATAALGAVTP